MRRLCADDEERLAPVNHRGLKPAVTQHWLQHQPIDLSQLLASKKEVIRVKTPLNPSSGLFGIVLG